MFARRRVMPLVLHCLADVWNCSGTSPRKPWRCAGTSSAHRGACFCPARSSRRRQASGCAHCVCSATLHSAALNQSPPREYRRASCSPGATAATACSMTSGSPWRQRFPSACAPAGMGFRCLQVYDQRARMADGETPSSSCRSPPRAQQQLPVVLQTGAPQCTRWRCYKHGHESHAIALRLTMCNIHAAGR